MLDVKKLNNTFCNDLLAIVDSCDLSNKWPALYLILLRYADDLVLTNEFYIQLDSLDRLDFCKFFLNRFGLHENLKLPINSAEKEKQNKQIDCNKLIFQNKSVCDLTPLGFNNLKVLNSKNNFFNLTILFQYETYTHKYISVKPGDTVIDIGGYIGDSALYFLYKAAFNCNIHIFELHQAHIDVMKENLKLNKALTNNVHINQLALTNQSEQVVEYTESGAGTSLSNTENNSNNTTIHKIKTITLDDYIKSNNVKEVNFIKMDIEGAEMDALLGAEQTIKQFKPTLAISIYHKQKDIYEIPALIQQFVPEYSFHFKWTDFIHGTDGILFAEISNTPNTNTENKTDQNLELYKKLIIVGHNQLYTYFNDSTIDIITKLEYANTFAVKQIKASTTFKIGYYCLLPLRLITGFFTKK